MNKINPTYAELLEEVKKQSKQISDLREANIKCGTIDQSTKKKIAVLESDLKHNFERNKNISRKLEFMESGLMKEIYDESLRQKRLKKELKESKLRIKRLKELLID